jgi:hypothetical protein
VESEGNCDGEIYKRIQVLYKMRKRLWEFSFFNGQMRIKEKKKLINGERGDVKVSEG